jgi:hypothetical protein
MTYKLRTAMMSAAVALIAGAVGFTGIAPSYAGMMNTGPPLQKTENHSSDLLNLAAWIKKHSKKCYYHNRWSYNCSRHRERFVDRQSGYSNYYRDDYYDDYYPRRRYWRQEPGFTIRLGN